MTEDTEPREDDAAEAAALVQAVRDRLCEREAALAEPPEPGDSDGRVVTIRRGGGRVLPDNPQAASPPEVLDLAAVLDGVAVGEVSGRVARGDTDGLAALEPWALIEQAQPRSPVEAHVLRAMVLAAAQQRQLVALSGRSTAPDRTQRYGELALRAGREVCRAAETWRKLRQPYSVNVGPGGQANVVGGDQHIHRGDDGTGGTD